MAKIGLNAKLYRGVAGSTAATEMLNVTDVTYNDERSVADISTRGSDLELGAVTLRKLTLDWEMFVDECDGDYEAIADAYLNKTAIALVCVSSVDGSGIDGDFLIVKLNQKQPLKDAIKAEVSVIPTYITRYPLPVAASSSGCP